MGDDDGAVQFDWDAENRKHLAAHKVTPSEFEQVMCHDPEELDCEIIDSEYRYRSVGVTDGGRLLSVVWTVRHDKVRAITAFPAPAKDKQAFLRRRK